MTAYMHPKTRRCGATSVTRGKTRVSEHTRELDGLVAEALAKQAKQPKTCNWCPAVALYLNLRGTKGSCKAHKPELMAGGVE